MLFCARAILERDPTHAVSRTASARRESAARLNGGADPAQCNHITIFVHSPEIDANTDASGHPERGMVYI